MRAMLLVLLLCWATTAHAQAQHRAHSVGAAHVKHPARPRATAAQPTARPHAERSEATVAGSAADSSAAATKSQAAPASRSPADSAAEIRTEGDTQVKVMEFTGLDVEGQLKTPQMLYFLKRLRAEFGRPRLPHRSLMPELQRSTESKAF
jgi:hypothetical protein